MNTQTLQRLADPQVLRQHFINDRQTMPTRRIWRGTTPPALPPHTAGALAGMQVPGPRPGVLQPLEHFLSRAESNALLVLHRGALVHEQYLHSMAAHDTHLSASISKSVVSLVAGVLLRDGLLQREQRLGHYVPELAGTAFGEANLDQLLHMGTAVSYGGRAFNKEQEARRFFEAVGMFERAADYTGPRTLLERLATAGAEQPPGQIFRYENGNTEALGEAIRRVTGQSLAQLVSELLWVHLGAGEDAHFGLDSTGRELASGRFSATARDLALLGELLRCGGSRQGVQVLDEALVADITRIPDGPAADVLGTGDTRANGPVLAYHDFWWLPLGEPGSFVARGRSGQRLYVDPRRELVIVHFGAQPVRADVPVPDFEQVFAHIGRQLTATPAG